MSAINPSADDINGSAANPDLPSFLPSARSFSATALAPREAVFIDGGVGDLATLIDGVKPGIRAFVLDPRRDGVLQIADTLAANNLRGLAALQIVAHGNPGELRLGSATLSQSSLDLHAGALAAIGAALAPDGDILLYACHAAQGAAGREFISALARATGANIAAATHRVGGSSAQSWQLDAGVGAVAADVPFTADTLARYAGTLVTPIDGQLLYLTFGNVPAEHAVLGYITNSNTGAVVKNTFDTPQTNGYTLAVDLPADLYFVGSADHLRVSVYRISTGALIETIQVGDPNANPAATDDDLVNTLAVDPINHILFVNRWGETTAETGIVKISYNPITGDLNNNGAFNSGAQQFLITNAGTGGEYTNGTSFQLDVATHQLYYTDWDNNYSIAPFSPQNAIYVVDYLAGSPNPTRLTTAVQFPANGSNGYIGNIAVDNTLGMIYFTVSDFTDPGQAHIYRMPIAGGTATLMLDIDNVHLGDSIPTGLSIDPNNHQLYVSLASYDPPAGGAYPNAPTANANHILVYQLNAAGTAFVGGPIANYSMTNLIGVAPLDETEHAGDSQFDVLPVISVTGTTTHAAEQGASIDLTTANSSSDADGGFYASATVQITGGTFVSNETSANDDHLTVLDGGVHEITGFFGATNISISYDVATEKLTLSGYDTIANYNLALAAVHYNTTGDNPTNYGNNATRTVTWTVSDGALGIPTTGAVNSTTTTLNIDAKNDAPVNNLPGTPSVNEDVQTALTGITITDVDADPANHDITVTFSVVHGTLNVLTGVAGGITAADITGGAQDTNTITITATQNQINATIAGLGLRYTSDLNFNSGFAAETLHIVTNDNSHTDSPAFPGAQTDTDDLTINVLAVNDFPNLQPDTTTDVAYTENATATGLFSLENVDAPLADVDLPANYLGGSIDLNITAGLVTGDRISLTGSRFIIVGGAVQDTDNGNAVVGTIGATNGTSHVTVSALTSAATPSVVDALLKSFGYDSTSDNPGAADRTITLTFNDGGNTGSGGAKTDAVTQIVHVTAVNDAPDANITPTTYSVDEQVALVLKNNGLSVTDVDGNAGVETITLTVTEGTLTVTEGDSGVTVDSGNGTGSVVISGTIAQLTALLGPGGTSNLVYIDDTDTPGASATLTLHINDNGSTGTPPPGALTDVDAATINITALNDAPVALMTTDPYAATEQTTLVLKGTGLSVSDVDSLGGIETITLSVGEGALTVTEGDSGVTVVSGNGTASVQVSGTLAQLNALLAAGGTSNLTYINDSDNPAASTTLTLHVDDGGNTGTPGAQTGTDTSTVNITAVNDAPDADITPASYLGQPNVAIDLKNNGLSVSDVDGNAGSETVTLSVASGTLTVTAGGSGAGVAGSGTSSVTITGTTAQINALLNTDATSTVSFLDSVGGSKTLTLLIHDNGNTGGGDLSAQDTAQIILDEPPAITGTGQTVGYTEQQIVPTAVVIDNDLVVSDPDAPGAGNQINSATVTITGAVAGDLLTATSIPAGITANFNGTDTLTLSGPATMADYQAALQSVTFLSTSDDPTNGGANPSRTITWVVNDIFDVPSSPVTSTVDVTAVNDGPVSVITPTSFNATEQTALDLKAQGLSVSDVDANTNSVTVTLSVTEGTLTVTAGGSGAGVAGSGTSTVTLTGTIAQINALLTTDATSTVSYTDGTDNPSASATLTLAIDDNGATGGGILTAQDSATISITAVNDGPAATITPPTYAATENVALDLKNNGLSVSDIDGNAGNMTVTLSVTEGILNVTAGGSGAGVSGSGTGTVTITGTLAQINALLITDGTSTVAYLENDDTPSATATLTLAINDNGNTGGGDLSAQDTATVNITAVNDLPEIENLTPSITYVIAAPPQTLSSGATVADADTATLAQASVTLTDHQAGDELSVSGATGGTNNGITWTYTSATGVLQFTGTSALANYQALLDQVQYRSTSGDPSNGGTTPSRDVAWVANDGTDPSVTQHTSISLGNQAPTVDLNGGGGGTNADQPFFENAGAIPIAPNTISIADPDDANLLSATIVLTNAKPGDALGISGSLPGGITGAVDTSVAGQITVTLSGNASRSNYQTAIQQVVFNNPGDNPDTTDRIITVTVNDGEDASNTATTTVHVNGVNDAPVNGDPGTQNVEANTATAIAGLSIADPDEGAGTWTTTLSVAHGTLAVASAGGAFVSGSGTSSVTVTGSVAAINTTLAAANNVLYTGAHDFFGTDTLNVLTNDNGNTGAGGALTDNDNVTINVNTLITGTPGPDDFIALPGQEMINGLSGIDTITFNFRLVDANVTYESNKVIIDGPSGSHTVLTGFEVFNFTDGTVHNDDGIRLIDDLFYYSHNHDVWNAHVDADAHFLTFGRFEGRDPSNFFSTVVYRSANPDVAASGGNPLDHFDGFGWLEGRVPSIHFDPAQYLAANPDVAAAGINPLRHYLQFGYEEGRLPFAPTELVAQNGFDYVYYLNHNPDVAASGVDPFQHFMTVGWQEGRNPNALFDTNGYLANYADVAAANINPLIHYNQFGWQEGRDPSPGFDTTDYLGAYADVNAAHVNPLTHFLQYGLHEGRSPFADGIWG